MSKILNAKRTPIALVILDGWGYREAREGNAIALAKTPFYDEIRAKYPQTLISTSGVCVGLPPGVMGNSEVGHMNMGAGRIIRTDIRRIDYAIETGEFFENPEFIKAMDGAKRRSGALHLLGLASDGKVHSSLDHLYALMKMARERGVQRVFIHAFTDGRDTMPHSGAGFISQIKEKIDEIGIGRIATIMGRYYAMDRDKRWDRTRRAYEAMVEAKGIRASDPVAAVRASYERGVTDEFIEPVVITDERNAPVATIKDGDSVIFFNFRSDRARQLTRALAVPDFDGFEVPRRLQIDYVCMTQYDKTFPLPIAFPPIQPHNVLGEIFGALNIRNLRVAETEKYAHVTYFFNGGREQEFPREKRLLVPSPKVATYDLEPEMSAYKITNQILRALDEGETDAFIINFANADMVGHTGNLARTIEAVEHVDRCLGWLLKGFKQYNGRMIVTADHGNAEQMIDERTGTPHTAHTTNLVPFHLIDDNAMQTKLRAGGALEDVAPTLLGMLEIPKPDEMTGGDLRDTD
jgi:2,3-bisphosphoglycerate-independent phosphoglycerate mutase